MELEKTKLSLFQIEAELRGLAEQRCDAQDRLAELEAMHTEKADPWIGEAIHATRDEITVVDGLIRAYIGKEVKKVDSIAHLLLDLEARRQIHAKEAARLSMLADGEEATAKRIKEMVLLVMDEFGTKILEGAIHDLKAQGNGGVQKLTIAQPDMVPIDLKRFTAEISSDVAGDFAAQFIGKYSIIEGHHPDTKAIRVILEEAERQRKAIELAALNPVLVSEEARADWLKEKLAALPGVPGCRLEQRGKQLRIR